MIFNRTTASLILALSICVGANQVMAQTVKRLECEITSMTVTIPNLERLQMRRSDLQAMYQKLPKNCQKTVFKYGNGVIDYVPHPKRCLSAFRELGSPMIEPVGYPMEYRASNKNMTWAFRGTILDPSIGKLAISLQNKLDIETMILAQKLKTVVDGTTITTVITSICE